MRAATTRLLQSAAILAFLATGTARAEEWQWMVTPYIWASDMSVDVKGVNGASIGSDLDFSDLLDKIDFAVMGHVEGRRGSVGFFLDLTYLATSDKYQVDRHPQIPDDTEIKTNLDTMLFEAAGFVRPFGENSPLELLAGVRTISMDLELKATLPAPISTTEKFKGDETLVDVFAGARMLVPLTEHVSLSLRGDVATGDTDFTWNLVGVLGYTFGQEQQYSALAGYRYLNIDLKDADGPGEADTDLTIRGPMAGFTFRF